MNRYIIPVLLSAMLTGCTLTQKKAAYNTLGAVGLSVQKSMQSAAAGRKAGKIDDAGWSRITKLHDTQFLPAYRTACDLAAQDLTSASPETLLAIQSQLIQLINQLLQ